MLQQPAGRSRHSRPGGAAGRRPGIYAGARCGAHARDHAVPPTQL